MTPSPSERKPKARIRSEHRAWGQTGRHRGFSAKREVRILDQGQLNGGLVLGLGDGQLLRGSHAPGLAW
jgi:hypothetical protein